MPYTNPEPIELPFPAGGVDQSLPTRNQPPLTTWDMLNCRAFPPSSDRLGGGVREGLSKLFEDIAGTTDAPRITHIEPLVESNNITDPNLFSSVPLVEDWSSYTVANPANLGALWEPYSAGSATSTITDTQNFRINSGPTLGINIDVSNYLLLSAFFVNQEIGITVIIPGQRQAATTANGYNANGFTNVGPLLAGGNNGQNGIYACFRAVGSNQVQAQILEHAVGGVPTVRAQSATLTLDGTTTDSDYTISIQNTGGVITAQFNATGVLSGGNDINVSLTWTTALTGRRGGLAAYPGASALTNRRQWKTVTLTRLVPPADTIFDNLSRSLANPIDPNRYFLTSTWRGVTRASDGTVTITAPGPTSATAPTHPAVDDSNDSISFSMVGATNANYDTTGAWAAFVGPTTERRGVVTGINLSRRDGAEDIGVPVFRVSEDFSTALIIRPTLFYRANTGVALLSDPLTQGRAFALYSGTYTRLDANTNLNINDGAVIFHGDTKLRWTDDGDFIRIYTNGILRKSFSPSSFVNWTPTISAALNGKIGVGFSAATRGASSATVLAEIDTVQVVQGEGVQQQIVSNIRNRLAIYSPEAIQIGNTENLTIDDCSGSNLQNPLPSAASFNRKFYAVDGSRALITDPATLSTTEWAAAVTDGVFPAGCRLVAFFRGAAYLAATDSDPTIWYKSRTLDPLDWDYAADPQVSTAVAGNNGEVGQPADAITALIPYSDDYLVFGMARSIGVLEGDPNYGGQFQIVSREAGIVGQRAWCFDDRGNLYFVGAGGLYRMFRGAFDPEPVGPRKLRRVLEELDIGTNLIQLAFRPTDRTVRIFVTPTDGTIGTHIVYDTRTDGFAFDQFPLAYGPWSVCQINGVADIDRNIVLGGDDGFIRRPDDEATSDDGEAIASYVEIPVPEAMGGRMESICQEIQFVMGEGGAPVQWRWFTAPSPEEVRLLLPGVEVAGGTITGRGFRPPIGLRATGAAHKLRLDATSSTAKWALERVTAEMALTGRRR